MSDVWDSAKPEEIISKLPSDWHDKLKSKTWQERKDALESLLLLVSSVIRLKPSNYYGHICESLINVIKKDANVVVVQLAGKVITGLAKGLRRDFAPYAHACLNALLDRSKEKKPNLTQVIREASDAIFISTNLEAMAEYVLPFLSNKTPSVRVETGAFLDRCFSTSRGANFVGNKKVLSLYVAPLLTIVGDQVGEVREAAFEALGCLHAFAGEQAVEPLLVDVEQIRVAKIRQVSQRRAANASPPSTPGIIKSPDVVKSRTVNNASDNNSLQPIIRSRATSKTVSNQVSKEETFIFRVDISEQMTSELMEQLDDKESHKVRKQAIDRVLEIIQEAKLIQPNLGDLPENLAKRLKEANKVLVQSALTVCEQLALSMGKRTADHIAVLGPAILTCFGDNKPQIKQQAVNCMNTWVDQCGGNLGPFFDSYLFSGALGSGNPTLRAELFTWLSKNLSSNNNNSNKPTNKQGDLNASIPYLLSALEDRSGEVRKAGHDALLPFMIHAGYEAFERAVEALKPASRSQLTQIIHKAKQSVLPSPSLTTQRQELGQTFVVVKKPANFKLASAKSFTNTVKPAPAVKSANSPVKPVAPVQIKRTASLIVTASSKSAIPRPISLAQPPNSSVAPKYGFDKTASTVAPILPAKSPNLNRPPSLFGLDGNAGKVASSVVYNAQPTPSYKKEIVQIPANIVDIKAKLNEEINVDRLVKQACALATKNSQQAGKSIHPHSVFNNHFEQRDTFFNCVLPGKRLKLREEIRNSQLKKAQLIGYTRHDGSWPVQCSDYRTSQIDYSEAEQLKVVLSQAFGVCGQVIKTRTMIPVDPSRTCYIDQVRGLGNFLKVEVVLHGDQTAEEGQKIAEEMMRNLNVSLSHLVAKAYIDLQIEKAQMS